MVTPVAILSTKKLKPSIIGAANKLNFSISHSNFINIKITASIATAKLIVKSQQHIVFTSANAVKGYKQNVDKFGLKLTPKFIYCLQGETLKAAISLTNVNIIAAAKDAAALANLIVQQNAVNEVSFICGNRRRDELPKLLQANKITVDEIAVYKTELAGEPAKTKYAAVLFFSPSAAEAFFQTNKLPAKITCFCIGNTTAKTVREHCTNPIIIAAAPSQKDILNSLIQYFIPIKNKRNDSTNTGRNVIKKRKPPKK
jgi:uroporphyrinogen-III synthase